MIEKFLKAKHWQIFIAVLGLPFLLDLILMPGFIESNKPGYMDKFIPYIMILFAGGLIGWLWSVAIGLQKKIPSGIKMKVRKFKIFLMITIAYISLLIILISTTFGGLIHNGQEPSGAAIGTFFAIILPLHLLSMFGMFYSLYFVAKTFKTVELQREVTFSDFAGEFFLFWFFPIGIWVIQPKINNMIMDENIKTD